MARKGLFERMGLIERTEEVSEKPMPNYEEDAYENETEPVEANVEGIGTEDIIGDAYRENGLSDMSKSIYKVGEIRKSLPKTMPSTAMRETVVGILATFGLTMDDVVDDATRRVQVVTDVCNQMCSAEANEIKQLEKEVEELYKEAEEKKNEIQQRNATLDKILSTCKDELSHIEEIRDFIIGDKEEA